MMRGWPGCARRSCFFPMKCRSCGRVNEERNKFCGDCGANLQEERRRAERRIIAWEPQQCRNCGSMNSAANKFCGMSGTALETERRRGDRREAAEHALSAKIPPKPQPIRAEHTPVVEPAEGLDDSNKAATSYLGAPPPSSSKPRGEWIRSSGSSFLGLEDEAPASSDYLFADEEPKSGSGWRVLVALLILGAVGYLIFKNWDSPTFAAALSQLQKHAQDSSATQNKPQPPSSVEQPSISTDENAAAADAAKQSNPPLTPDASKPAPTEPPANSAPEAGAKQKDDLDSSKKSSADSTPATDDQDNESAAPEPD